MTRTTELRKLTVRGVPVTTRTPRRYVVVDVRPEDVVLDDGVFSTGPSRYLRFADVVLRTDDLTRGRKIARRREVGRGVYRVVVDTTTGEEV